MEQTFAKVESELDQLERAFESGEMNAFGNRETQMEFSSSFNHISHLETEVFYTTLSILRFNNNQEHNPFKSVMAMTKDTSENSTQGDGDGANENSGNLDGTESKGESTTRIPQLVNSSFNSTFHHNRFYPSPKEGASFSETVKGRGKNGKPSRSINEDSDEEDEAKQDKAFAHVTHHFDFLESEFEKVSNYLHDVYQEVIQVDRMAEKLSSGGGNEFDTK